MHGWKQGGRSIGDERGKGGWGGQMLLTLCTLSWVSIFSILYLYTFCSVLIRRICSPIKYSVLFYLAIISFVCTDSVVILYWEIGCKLLLVMWRLMIGLTWMHLLNKKKNQIRGNFEQLSIFVVIYWYCWYSCVVLQLDCWVKSYIAVPYLQTPSIAMFVSLYTYMYVIITL